MGELFLRTVTVSLAVSLLLLPLLFLRGWLERRYAPQTRWLVWLGVAAVLLIAPLLPRMTAPVQVAVPARTVAYTQVGTAAPAAVPAPAPAVTNPAIIPNQPIQPAIPTASAPAPVTYRPVDWTEIAAVLWLAVAGVLLAVQAVRYGVTRRRLFRASRPVESRGGVELRVLAGLETPIAMGFFRPVVFLPAEETAPMALRHELKHIQRRDTWGKAFLFLACTLHWFNPLVWRMARWADRDVEACCDAAVVGDEDGAYKRAYGELLLASAAGERSLPFTTRFGGGKEQMKSRLAQLFQPGKRSRAFVCALLAAAVLLSGLVACTQQPPAETPKDPEPSAGEEIRPAAEDARPLTENTMPHLDFYDSETRFLVYHTRTGLYFHYGDSGEEFHVDTAQGERVMAAVDVRWNDGEVWFSDCFTNGDEIGYYKYAIQGRSVQKLNKPFDPEPELLSPADPRRIFDQGMYQPSHTYSLWSNALELSDGSLAALAVNRIIENGSTLDYLELVRMGEYWWEENRLLTPERIPGPVDYIQPDWGFVLHLPQSMEGRYLIERDYNADGLTSWSFYDKDSYAGPNGTGFLFTIYAQDAETARNKGEGSAILGEKNGIAYTMSAWPHREPGYSAGYLELLDAVETIGGEDLDLSGATRSTGPLWPLENTASSQEVILRANEGDKSITILAPDYGWVQSVAAGTVHRVAQMEYSGVFNVCVRHGNGWQTIYYLGGAWVKEGDQVQRGDALGYAAKVNDLSCLTLTWLEGSEFVDPRTVDWRRRDFSPISADDLLMSGDNKVAEALRAVLRGETAFYNMEAQEYQYVNALPDSDGVGVTVRRYAEVDMDSDTIPELVLWLQRGDNEYVLGSIVLHYEHGLVCGYPMGFRSMNLLNLKTDGSYPWSGGASDNGWGKLRFTGSGETEEISGEGQEAKADATWYDFLTGQPLARAEDNTYHALPVE